MFTAKSLGGFSSTDPAEKARYPFDDFVNGKVVSGHTLEIRRLKGPHEAKHCQITFIRSGQKRKAQQLIEAVKGLPVLTVGEEQGFGAMGGLVYLTVANDQVSIKINAAGTASVALKISAKLLSLANDSRGRQR